MRNPSKNTIKKMMRPCNNDIAGWGHSGWGMSDPQRAKSYFLFNDVGARLYVMSKGKICNREPKNHEKYLTEAQLKLHNDMKQERVTISQS